MKKESTSKSRQNLMRLQTSTVTAGRRLAFGFHVLYLFWLHTEIVWWFDFLSFALEWETKRWRFDKNTTWWVWSVSHMYNITSVLLRHLVKAELLDGWMDRQTNRSHCTMWDFYFHWWFGQKKKNPQSTTRTFWPSRTNTPTSIPMGHHFLYIKSKGNKAVAEKCSPPPL